MKIFGYSISILLILLASLLVFPLLIFKFANVMSDFVVEEIFNMTRKR